VERAGPVKVTQIVYDDGEELHAPGSLAVVGAEVGLADGQGPLVENAGAVEVSLIAQDDAEVVEAPGGVGMVGAEVGLADG
jgi:hypothetical protein